MEVLDLILMIVLRSFLRTSPNWRLRFTDLRRSSCSCWVARLPALIFCSSFLSPLRSPRFRRRHFCLKIPVSFLPKINFRGPKNKIQHLWQPRRCFSSELKTSGANGSTGNRTCSKSAKRSLGSIFEGHNPMLSQITAPQEGSWRRTIKVLKVPGKC